MDERSHGPGVNEIQMLHPPYNLMRLQRSIFKNLSGDGRILS